MAKKLLALLLCVCMLLPFTACAAPTDDVAEIAPEPVMDAADLEKLALNDYVFPGLSQEESDEIWEWAKQLVEEWNERYQAILEDMKSEKEPTLIKKADDMDNGYASAVKNNKEYTLSIRTDTHKKNYEYEGSNGATKNKATRTLETLVGWAESTYAAKTYEQDQWGGFMDESMKQEATGYFYTKKIDGRWWLITPTGYPTLMRAIMNIEPVKWENADQQKSVVSIYGSNEKWSIATTAYLRDIGIYTTNISDYHTTIPEEYGFSFGTYAVSMITPYAIERGIGWDAGSTYFDVNISDIAKRGAKSEAHQVMPVFNRDFEEFADNRAKELLYDTGAYKDPRIMVISSDNEIPIHADMLERYFVWSNPEKLTEAFPGREFADKIRVYYETYATTITWMLFMTGKTNIKDLTVKDSRDQDLSFLFQGFVYDRLMKVSSEAIKRYAPNHIYLGNRSLSGGESIDITSSNSVLDREWIVRFSSQYIDAYGINWYGRWNPDAQESANLQLWTGDKPIFITEMGFKTDEGTGIPDPGYDNNGAGFWVKTQKERAQGFENFILNLMEWPNFVGYEYYEYHHSKSGNTYSGSQGIINDFGVYDPEFTASMAELNNNAYNLIRFLDYRQKNWSKYFN